MVSVVEDVALIDKSRYTGPPPRVIVKDPDRARETGDRCCLHFHSQEVASSACEDPVIVLFTEGSR